MKKPPAFKFKPTPTHIRFGRVIQQRRELKALTQRQLAEHLGVHHTTLSKIERGAQEITLTQALLFAAKLGVNLPSLFSLADTPLPPKAASEDDQAVLDAELQRRKLDQILNELPD